LAPFRPLLTRAIEDEYEYEHEYEYDWKVDDVQALVAKSPYACVNGTM